MKFRENCLNSLGIKMSEFPHLNALWYKISIEFSHIAVNNDFIVISKIHYKLVKSVFRSKLP